MPFRVFLGYSSLGVCDVGNRSKGNGSSIGPDLCDVPAGTPSAAATATSCVFCRGSATPDIVGHEVGHIMARNMRRNPDGSPVSLGSTNEAGALNEAMGDFFGEALERFITGSNDWITGTGFLLPLRSMIDPPSIPQGPFRQPRPLPESRFLHGDSGRRRRARQLHSDRQGSVSGR